MQQGTKPSSKVHIFAVLFVAALAVLLLAAGAIYTAIASPTSWVFPESNEPSSSRNNGKSEPEQFRFREDVDPQSAALINAGIAATQEPIAPATPFSIAAPEIADRAKMLAVECLTAAIYYEAASESVAGQRAVAQVVLNRVRHPAYANSVCGVVFQGSERSTGCQFSFTCDGSLARRPSKGGWARAQTIASMALAGYVEPSVGFATHYHTVWVVPYWSASLTKLTSIGAHIFYKWTGRNGTRVAFTNRYSGIEQLPVSTISAILPEAKNDFEAPAEALVVDAKDASRDSKLVEEPRETGLLITPQAYIKRGELARKEQIDSTDQSNLIVDGRRPTIRTDNNALLMDR